MLAEATPVASKEKEADIGGKSVDIPGDWEEEENKIDVGENEPLLGEGAKGEKAGELTSKRALSLQLWCIRMLWLFLGLTNPFPK
eukprot:1321796-Amorphochlora_amoeboformis.AAC.1